MALFFIRSRSFWAKASSEFLQLLTTPPNLGRCFIRSRLSHAKTAANESDRPGGGRYGRDDTGGGFGLGFPRARFASTGMARTLSDNSLADLISHLRLHAVRTDGPFVLRSGISSDWYIDARQTTFDGSGARLVGRVVLSYLDDQVVAIGGLTMGADPIAVATAMTAAESGQALRAFSIRKAPKGHGTGGRLVGPVGMGDAVAMLEDTATTGAALVEAIEVAVAEGLRVVQAISLIDRSGGAVSDLLTSRGIPYRGLVGPEDLGLE